MTRQELHKSEPVFSFTTYSEWLKWLEKNHSGTSGFWMKFAKKNSGATTITYEEAREGALIYGWIDGVINKYDEKYYLIRFTPRRPKSVWSQINRGLIEQLLDQGKMHPAGLVHVEAAKADGRWDNAYEPASTAQVPEDFAQALKENLKAEAFFNKISKSNRYAFLYRLQTSKADNRDKLIKRFVSMLENEETFH